MGRMTKISRDFYSLGANAIYFTVIPLFYLLFTVAIEPFEIRDFLSAGRGYFTENLIFTTLSLMGVLLGSRMILFVLRHSMELNWPLYILWCIGEILVTGLVWSILLGMEWKSVIPYHTVLLTGILYLAGIALFPYSIITMGIQLHVLEGVKQPDPEEDNSLVRFHDDQNRLKFIISSTAVLYIEAEKNIVHIVHLDNGRVKDFTLRSSMRALEETLPQESLIRCHRSYFVNADHVEQVRKDSNGYALAKLDREGLAPVPVSRKYYDSLSALL